MRVALFALLLVLAVVPGRASPESHVKWLFRRIRGSLSETFKKTAYRTNRGLEKGIAIAFRRAGNYRRRNLPRKQDILELAAGCRSVTRLALKMAADPQVGELFGYDGSDWAVRVADVEASTQNIFRNFGKFMRRVDLVGAYVGPENIEAYLTAFRLEIAHTIWTAGQGMYDLRLDRMARRAVSTHGGNRTEDNGGSGGGGGYMEGFESMQGGNFGGGGDMGYFDGMESEDQLGYPYSEP